FSSRRRHTRFSRDWSSDVCSSDLAFAGAKEAHDFVVETTWGQLADHAICTPAVVTEEMVNDAVQIVGKGGKVTITAVGHIDEKRSEERRVGKECRGAGS